LDLRKLGHKKSMKKIWIAWEKHRRTTELASALNGIKTFQFEAEANRLVRYPYLLCKTIMTILKERPQLVIVQNPSLILSFFMVTLGKRLVRRVIVDAHNEGIRPFHPSFDWLLPVYRTIQKRADLTLVTNGELAREVLNNNGKPFVLEDKIPQFSEAKHITLRGQHNLVFICTFEKDEPYQEVIHAASLLDPSIYIYVTGRYEKAHPDIISQAPSNLIFTGFLAEDQYVSLLQSCDAIIDLTLMQDCLVCGGYEAVALGKPLILSNTPALKKYFCQGAVYTANNAEEIARAIQGLLENKERLQDEMRILKAQLTSAWEEKHAKLLSILEELVDRGE
jgi:glycosyltransferase involved in cell wall biosynthesis